MVKGFPHHCPAPELIITLQRVSRYYLHRDLKTKTTIKTATTTTTTTATTKTTTKTAATPAAAVLITMEHLYHNGKLKASKKNKACKSMYTNSINLLIP